jgi:hypothetical protein
MDQAVDSIVSRSVGSLIQHASSDEKMSRNLRDAWVTFIQKQDQNEVDAITRQWSVGRDENRFDATACDRLLVSVLEEVLAHEPRAAFVRAMTDRTRSEMFMHSVGQDSITRFQRYERHPLPLEFSPPVGAGEPPPADILKTV